MAHSDSAQLRQALVEHLKRTGAIHTAPVEAAFRAVPRHVFVPHVPPAQAYQDQVIPTKQIQGITLSSSTRPGMMAVMLEQLALAPGQRVLEIGAGTGYNAALMSHIVGPTGQVITIDIDHEVVAAATTHLARAGYAHITVVAGDGGFGYSPQAPYDRIILTVAASDIAPAWWTQLHPAGRLVLPLSLHGSIKSVAFERDGPSLRSMSVADAGFMRLRGAFIGPEQRVAVDAIPGLTLEVATARTIDTTALAHWLQASATDHRTSVTATMEELHGSFPLWLALQDATSCALLATGPVAAQGVIPGIMERAGLTTRSFTVGLLSAHGLAVMMGPPGTPSTVAWHGNFAPAPMWVRQFGADGDLAERLRFHVEAWQRAGRPATQHLHVQAYVSPTHAVPATHAVMLHNTWTHLGLDWHAT